MTKNFTPQKLTPLQDEGNSKLHINGKKINTTIFRADSFIAKRNKPFTGRDSRAAKEKRRFGTKAGEDAQ